MHIENVDVNGEIAITYFDYHGGNFQRLVLVFYF